MSYEDEYEPYVMTLDQRANTKWYMDQGRPRAEGKMVVLPKKYIRWTEARKDNVLKYEEAIDTVGIVAGILTLKADIAVSYGYKFVYDNEDEPLEERKKERIKFLKLWKRHVKLSEVIKMAVLCAEGLGDAFIEKIYDEKSYNEGGWGIKKLKIVHPATVEIERDVWGNPRNYIQDITKTEHRTGSYFIPRQGLSSPGRVKRKAGKDEWKIVVPAEHVVHLRRRAFTNEAYGRSLLRPIRTLINILLGVENDYADIIRTMARPLTVWYMGDAENPMPRKHMESIAKAISMGLSKGSDIAIDGRVKAEVIGAGGEAMKVEGYLEHLIRSICTTLGVPATIFGLVPSSSGQADEISEELFRRRIMSLQEDIGNVIVNEIFRDIFLFHPADLKTAEGRKMVHEITPTQYAELPYIRFNDIENIANRRLRVREEVITGVLTLPEAREEFGRPQYYEEDELHPQLQQLLAQAENLQKSTETMDRQLDIQEKSIEVQKETAKISAAVAKSRSTNTKTSAISSDRTKSPTKPK